MRRLPYKGLLATAVGNRHLVRDAAALQDVVAQVDGPNPEVVAALAERPTRLSEGAATVANAADENPRF